MSKSNVHRVDVHFGDCDPAGIVFFPNFSGKSTAAPSSTSTPFAA